MEEGVLGLLSQARALTLSAARQRRWALRGDAAGTPAKPSVIISVRGGAASALAAVPRLTSAPLLASDQPKERSCVPPNCHGCRRLACWHAAATAFCSELEHRIWVAYRSGLGPPGRRRAQ